MTERHRLALFDLDGTLVDSAPDIAAALARALATCGLAATNEARVRDFIGDGASRLVHRAICNDRAGSAPDDLFLPVYAAFQEAYAEQVFVHSRLYPGAADTLATLAAHGWRLGLVTNKPARFTQAVLQAAGLDTVFDIVVSGDTLAHSKPHPAPLLHAAAACATNPAHTAMIGDSCTDLEAARAAGIKFIAVDYGYAGGADLGALGATHVMSSLPTLPPLLHKLLP